MRIFRIEHRIHDKGPYYFYPDVMAEVVERRRFTYSEDGSVLSDNHPSPTKDGISFTSDHVFGFDKLESLYDWFGKENIPSFENQGFLIKIFEVDPEHVVAGKSQIAFVRNKSTVVGSV